MTQEPSSSQSHPPDSLQESASVPLLPDVAVAMPSPSAAGADGQTLQTWIDEEIVKPSMLSRMTSCESHRMWLVQCRQSNCRLHCGSRTSCFKTLQVPTLSASQVCFVSASAPAQDKSDVGNHTSPLLSINLQAAPQMDVQGAGTIVCCLRMSSLVCLAPVRKSVRMFHGSSAMRLTGQLSWTLFMHHGFG